jgi:hypothetical protein
MLCGQNTRTFFEEFKNPADVWESCTEDSAKIRGGDCNTPRTCPNFIMNCNYVL